MIVSTCFLLFSSAYLALSSPLEERAGCVNPFPCNSDNVYRALANPTRSKDSHSFCSYLGGQNPSSIYTATVSATTVTVTVPTTTVFYSTYHIYTNTQFLNAHTFSSGGRPPPITYPTPSPAPTTTYNPTPSYLAQYLPERLSSACNCFPPPYVTVPGTATATVGKTTSCITHTDTYTTSSVATYAEACDPSVTIGQQYVTANPTRAVRTVLPIPVVDQKITCCQRCADLKNCLFWNYNQAGQCKLVYGIDNIDPQQTGIPDQCPNGAGPIGLGARAGNDAPDVYVPGLCASELYGEYQSSQAFGDPCINRGYCDRCAVYGGSECK